MKTPEEWADAYYIMTDKHKAVGAIRAAVAEARAEEREACAKTAENVTGGFTANIRTDESEQELVRDPDGPWVFNLNIAAAIRARGKGRCEVDRQQEVKRIICQSCNGEFATIAEANSHWDSLRHPSASKVDFITPPAPDPDPNAELRRRDALRALDTRSPSDPDAEALAEALDVIDEWLTEARSHLCSHPNSRATDSCDYCRDVYAFRAIFVRWRERHPEVKTRRHRRSGP